VKEAGGEKLEECCKEQTQLAEASKEGLGSEWAVVPMIMIMIMIIMNSVSHTDPDVRLHRQGTA
jgi:hypothetical protein